MSKSVVLVVVAIVVVVIAGGAYHFLKPEAQPAAAPAVVEIPATPQVATTTPKPDHGNFQKRFQPSMPAGTESGK